MHRSDWFRANAGFPESASAFLTTLGLDGGVTFTQTYSTADTTVASPTATAPNAATAVAATKTGTTVGSVYMLNPAAAGTTNAATQLSLEGATGSETMTSPLQPDVPRCITITVTDSGVEISAFQIDIVGKAPDGSAATDQFLFAGGLVQVGTTVFAELTSITVTSITETGATAKTLDAGWNTSIGVPVPAGSTGLTITHVDAAGTEEAAASVDATNNSFVFTTAPDGAKDFSVTYEYLDPTAVEGITNLDAAIVDAASIRTQVTALVADNLNLRKIVNSLIDALQTAGIVT